MLQYERFETILQTLQKQSSVRVTDLSQMLGVSESTVRRDIADLDRAGRLKKVFGGAVPAETGALDPAETGIGSAGMDSFVAEDSILDGPAFAKRNVNVRSMDLSVKERLRASEKNEVADYAASLIEAGDLVYIDAGTTTGSMIDRITCRQATYVTNGVRHAIRLAARGCDVYLLSGKVKSSTEAVIGHDAVNTLQKYHFSKAFIGTDGVDEEHGLTTADIEESMVKTEAIRRAGEVYILADSSKFGLVASITFAPLSSGTVITDRLTQENYRSQTGIIEVNKTDQL